MVVKVDYFAIRGRAECIRLALVVAGVDYEDVPTDRAALKEAASTADYPFGQVPALRDEDGTMYCQQDAIMRHIGRQHGLCGSSLQESALVDMVMAGVEDIRRAYINLIYQGQLSAEAKASYYTTHIDPSTIHERCGGAHFYYLSKFLERNGGGQGFVVGQQLTIADIQLFDVIDIHLRDALFPEELKKEYPLLVAYHARIAQTPAIAAYLTSPRRAAALNANGLG